MFRTRRPAAVALLLASSVLVAACDIGGIGNGNKLETLKISRQTALIDRESKASYLCFTDKLQLVGTFTDGGLSDYSARGSWTSSNPDIVAVSNGDILVPGSETAAFASGTIVPKAEGTATITANFVGLSASYEVEVHKLPDDAIEITETEITVAPETVRGLNLTATVDGYVLNATAAASWSFVAADETEQEENDAIAEIGVGSGIVVAKLAAGLPATLRARAEFPLCKGANGVDPLRFEADVTVDVPESLTLEREFVDAPNDELIIGTTADPDKFTATTEAFRVAGTFSNGAEQDLTGQVRVNSDNDDVATSTLVIPNLVSALKVGTVTLQAGYGGDDENDEDGDVDPPEVLSNTVFINVVAGAPGDFTIAPLNNTITALERQQFTATGTYQVNGETRTQPVTRGVTWSALTLDDKATGIAVISTAVGSAGLLTSLQPAAGAVKVKATRGTGDNAVSKDTALCIVEPGTEAGECPPPEESTDP